MNGDSLNTWQNGSWHILCFYLRFFREAAPSDIASTGLPAAEHLLCHRRAILGEVLAGCFTKDASKYKCCLYVPVSSVAQLFVPPVGTVPNHQKP
jgi:hypothetical protein